MASTPDFLTVREAAITRGCGIARIYSLLWSGKLEGATKDSNGSWRIPARPLPLHPHGTIPTFQKSNLMKTSSSKTLRRPSSNSTDERNRRFELLNEAHNPAFSIDPRTPRAANPE